MNLKREGERRVFIAPCFGTQGPHYGEPLRKGQGPQWKPEKYSGPPVNPEQYRHYQGEKERKKVQVGIDPRTWRAVIPLTK